MKQNELPAFFFVENKSELPGAGLVQSNEPPFYLARVLKFKSDTDAENFEQSHNRALFIKVSMYNIYLLLQGSLQQAGLENNKQLLHQMADFYMQEKIKGNESYHKKFITAKQMAAPGQERAEKPAKQK